jgi:phosphate transport system permease protein
MSSASVTNQGAGVEPAPQQAGKRSARSPRAKLRTSLLAHGQPQLWLNGGALAICLYMILGLLGLVFWQGMATFWPVPAVEVHTVAGKRYLGEVIREEKYQPEASAFAALAPQARAKAEASVEQNKGWSKRRLLRTANFDLTQTHHHWVSDFAVIPGRLSVTHPGSPILTVTR